MTSLTMLEPLLAPIAAVQRLIEQALSAFVCPLLKT